MSTVGAARAVFSNRSYTAFAVATAAVFWLIFNILDGILLLSPPAFYYPIPDDALLGFILSYLTAALVGVVVSMNTYMFRNLKTNGSSKTPFLSGSSLGTVSSMCAGCSSVGFYLAASFGTAGVAASTFLSNYQLPLRLIAIGLLVWAYYSSQRRIKKSCSVRPPD